MVGPLAEYLEARNADEKLHLVITYSREMPFRPAWKGWPTYRDYYTRRLYFRPWHVHLGRHSLFRAGKSNAP